MAKKVNKPPAPGGRAAGKARRGSRAAKEPARPSLPVNGPPPGTWLGNRLVPPVPYGTMGEVTTYVYDAQNRLTRIEDPRPAPCLLAPDLQKLRAPKQKSSRKRGNGKTPQKSNNAQRQRKTS
jgi:hypothetical protein